MSTKEAIDALENEAEDILAVTEKLSADLAADVVEESDELEESEELSEGSDEETGSEDSGSTEEAEETLEQLADDSETVEETEEEVQESEQANSENEDVDSANEEVTESVDSEESESEEVTDSTESDEGSNEVEALVEKLQKENAALRSALHKVLAERVVDVKIALGVEEASDRAKLVEEHSTRTASSLADALRDLEKYPKRTVTEGGTIEMDRRSLAVDNTESAEFTGLTSKEEEEVPVEVQEKVVIDTFVDVLMNRKKLN